jgi:maleate isomerase
MTGRTLIGLLTPSSNIVLEPTIQAMLARVPGVTAHFSRFRVTEISLSDKATAQFDDRPMLRAAELLADAKVDVIAWAGTSSAWLGIEADRRLCAGITAVTGIKATTAMFALHEVLRAKSVARLSLVTPYIDEVQARIAANFAAVGIACPTERHMGIRENFAFSDLSDRTVADLIRDVARPDSTGPRPDAVATICTNMRGAARIAELEEVLGLPVYDTIAATLWKCLSLSGMDPSLVTGWGSLFEIPGAAP